MRKLSVKRGQLAVEHPSSFLPRFFFGGCVERRVAVSVLIACFSGVFGWLGEGGGEVFQFGGSIEILVCSPGSVCVCNFVSPLFPISLTSLCFASRVFRTY